MSNTQLTQRPLLIIHCVVFILHFSSLSAQTPSHEQLTGIWIGVHTEIDTDAFCPLPTYLQLDADGTYHLGMVNGLAVARTSTWAVEGDVVRLDSIHFAPGLVKAQNNLLRIGKTYPMTFRKFDPVLLDSVSARKQLTGRVWQSDSVVVSLFANGKASLENRATKQRTAHFWQLARLGGSVFLVIRGNTYNRDGGYIPLWQLSHVSPGQMQVVGWRGRAVATETFRFVKNLAPGDSCRPSGFQLCDNCFNARTTFTTSGNRYGLREWFTKHYQAGNQVGESGLVRIEFVVNCAGQSGLFNVQGFSDDYTQKTFSILIINQLLAACRKYIVTNPSVWKDDDPDSRPSDVPVLLTFRLKDGQLIDLLP